MSLTSILKDNSLKALHKRLKKDFKKPRNSFKEVIKVPLSSTRPGLIGTAFDYLFRFNMEYNNKNRVVKPRYWIAEKAYKLLRKELLTNEKVIVGYGFDTEVSNSSRILKIIDKQFNIAKKNYSQFLKTGGITNELISSSIFLAKLETYYRIESIDKNYSQFFPEDVKDLSEMFLLLKNRAFKVNKKCYLNPTFGKGSDLVGGADADIIIDNTLIDIKATKRLAVSRLHFNQLVLYYILSHIGGINNKPNDKPIDEIAVYFARFDVLWTVHIKDIISDKSRDNFIEWFVKYIKKVY